MPTQLIDLLRGYCSQPEKDLANDVLIFEKTRRWSHHQRHLEFPVCFENRKSLCLDVLAILVVGSDWSVSAICAPTPAHPPVNWLQPHIIIIVIYY